MKIALIGQKGIPSQYGGIEKHVQELAVRLKRDGFDVDAYARRWYTDVSLKEYKGVRIINLPSIRTKHLDAITHTFISSLHASFNGNDIIHYHGVGPALLAWMPRVFSNAKVVVTFHCIDRFHQKWGWFSRAMLRLGEWAANKFAHETIAVSKTITQYCSLEYNNSVEYIPNGISEANVLPAQKITEEFGLTKGSYFVMVSRLVRHKGAHFLIDAYNQLDTDKKLVIVGGSAFTDDYVQELHDMAKGNSNIIFTGFQSGDILDELFSNAYAFVHPSMSEGLPIAVLEALSYGNCVIASDIPENMEVIRRHGYAFESENVNDLVKNMQFALDNPEKVARKAKAGQKFVLKTYNWEAIVTQTAELYKRVRFSEFTPAYNVKHTS